MAFGRRPGAGVNRRSGFRGIGGGVVAAPVPSPYALDYTDGTFARASAATHWDPVTKLVTYYASGVARIFGDGSYYAEGARTNYADNSTAANWASPPLTGTSIGPDGVADSAAYDTGDGGSLTRYAAAGTLPKSTTCVSTMFRKNPAKGAAHRTTTWRDWDFAVHSVLNDGDGTWTRETALIADSGTSTNPPQVQALMFQAPIGDDYELFGGQIEAGEFPSQLIETAGAAATRLADDMVVGSGDVPATFYAGAWSLDVTPGYSAAAWILEGNIGYVYYRDANNYLRLNADGKWSLAIAGNLATQTTASTFAAFDVITLTVDIPSGDLTTSGAGNDGTFSTTGGTWGAGAIEVGQSGAGALAIFALLTKPAV